MTIKPQGVTSLLSFKVPVKCGINSHSCRNGTHPKQRRDPLTSTSHSSDLIVPPGPQRSDNSVPLPALDPCSSMQEFRDEVSPLAQILRDVPRKNSRMSRAQLDLKHCPKFPNNFGNLGKNRSSLRMMFIDA